MKKSIRWILVGLFLISASGCMSVRLSTMGVDKPVMMTGAEVERDYSLVRSFRRSVKGYFLVYHLVTISDPKIQKAVSEEIATANGDAAVNVNIKGQTTIVDGLASMLTWTLFSMRTYTVEGDIIKYKD